MTMTVDTEVSEREHRKYELWSEFVESNLREPTGLPLMAYFEWLDYMGLD